MASGNGSRVRIINNQNLTLCTVIRIVKDEAAKRDLWLFIKRFMANNGDNYFIFGDFNSVRCPEERMGPVFCQANADAFNAFISDAGLIDIPMGQYKFTRLNTGGTCGAKLDRFLVSRSCLAAVENIKGIILDRNVSDHHAILLFQQVFDYGPVPFKVFNSWGKRDDFKQLVVNNWLSSANMHGDCPIQQFRIRMKHLKDEIKKWKTSFVPKANLVNLQQELVEFDKKVDNGVLINTNSRRRVDILHEILEIEKEESLDIQQKSKIKWSVEGDENSRFFHAYINKSRKNLAIQGIKLVNGFWLDDPQSVKNAFVDHYSKKFKRGPYVKLVSRSSRYRSLTDDQVFNLERPVTESEIKEAVWECGSDKSPGPDGFTFGFIKEFWDILKSDVFNFVQRFFQTGYLPVGCNSSFITLISKVPNPFAIDDFRSISLIGLQYKIIAKIFANRLSKVLGSVISDTQSAFIKGRNILDGPLILNEVLDFIKGRNILDGPLILNEVLDWYKKKKKKAIFLKLDIAKAYDF